MQYRKVDSSSAWSDLRCGSNEEQGISIPTIPYNVNTGHGQIRHALGPRGEPRLLLPVAMYDKLPTFKDSPGMVIKEATYSQNGRPARFIDIACQMPELESVFSEVTEELIDRIRRGASCTSALLSTLEDFHKLLVAASEQDIKDERILGLLGELLILERFLHNSPKAWMTWRGPKGDRHDFRCGNTSMEVKSGSRTSSKKITISSVDQLAPPKEGKLFLAHLVLEKSVEGELSVGRVVERILEKSSSRKDVLDLIVAAGCHDPDSELWNRIKFNFENETFYAVTSAFPSITPDLFTECSIPKGIESLTYVVDLSFAEDFRLDIQHTKALEEQFIV